MLNKNTMRRNDGGMVQGKDALLGTTTGPNTPGQRLARIALLVSAVCALWLATRPYRGIVHDARLYLVQAQNALEPEKFGADLFFKYGSQDSFSVFSSLYSPAVEFFGPGGAHLLFWALGQAVWVASLSYMAVTLYNNRRLAIIAIAAVMSLSPFYGWGVLQYGEPFATPRIFVEAFSVLMISLIYQKRVLQAGGLLVAAFLLHPLMALPGLVFYLLLTVPFFRAILPLTVVGLVALVALALTGNDPFTRVLETYDPEWLEIVFERSPHAFIQDWAVQGAILGAMPLVALSFVTWRGDGGFRRIAAAGLIMGLVFLLISWIGGDLVSNVLILNLQLWRGLWMVALLGNFFAAYVVYLLPVNGRSRTFFIIAIVMNAIETQLGFLPLAATLVVVASGLAFWADQSLSGKVLRGIQLIGSVILAAATLFLIAEILFKSTSWDVFETLPDLARVATIFLAAFVLVSWPLPLRAGKGLCIALSVALIGWSLFIVDARDAKARYISSSEPPEAEVFEQIVGRNTYWEGGVDILWFKMRQPSFFSCTQGAGVMFFRDTAIVYARRSRVLKPLNTPGDLGGADALCFQRTQNLSETSIKPEQIRAACDALPKLDVMVLRTKVPDLPYKSWQPDFPVPPSGFDVTGPAGSDRRGDLGESDGLFYIYYCDEIREGIGK
ncbi:hypothetical protein [Aliiroseovarius subalbicans]|uniref:hypothetical protein n=1 Tax=Aliiroseovarius subalbicans TaxID=2925840 RepID=UPI001F59669A|nr:hypothetical protein [Aliiroseovarius subalbicans]MCI2400429.1 hypothetical protein [Aliiroseovarius subalbicans]